MSDGEGMRASKRSEPLLFFMRMGSLRLLVLDLLFGSYMLIKSFFGPVDGLT